MFNVLSKLAHDVSSDTKLISLASKFITHFCTVLQGLGKWQGEVGLPKDYFRRFNGGGGYAKAVAASCIIHVLTQQQKVCVVVVEQTMNLDHTFKCESID